jgi:hypothetical protein
MQPAGFTRTNPSLPAAHDTDPAYRASWRAPLVANVWVEVSCTRRVAYDEDDLPFKQIDAATASSIAGSRRQRRVGLATGQIAMSARWQRLRTGAC